MTAPISLGDIALFKLLIWSWIHFAKRYLSWKLSFHLDFQFGTVQVFTVCLNDLMTFLGVCNVPSFASDFFNFRYSLSLFVRFGKDLSSWFFSKHYLFLWFIDYLCCLLFYFIIGFRPEFDHFLTSLSLACDLSFLF